MSRESHGIVPRVRLSPELRRQQLIEVGISLLSEMSLSKVNPETLAERAGVSRGLLYHYFGGAEDVQIAIAHQLAAELLVKTAPIDHPEPLVRLRRAVEVFLRYLEENTDAYRAIRRGASAGSGEMYAIYEESRRALIDRIFEPSDGPAFIADTPLARKLSYAWSAFSEDLMLSWATDPGEITREEIVDRITEALPMLLGSEWLSLSTVSS